MGRRTIAVIIAIILALAAAALVWWYVSSVRDESQTQTETQSVLVASQTIPARTTGEDAVANRLVEVKNVPVGLIAPGAIADQGELKGRVITAEVATGQQIVDTQLAAPEEIGASYTLEEGMRAVSVPIGRVNAVGGTLKAGDRVDIIASFENESFSQANASEGAVLPAAERDRVRQATRVDPNTSRSTYSRAILQQVELLQVDRVPTGTGGGGLAGNEDEQAPNDPVIIVKVSLADAEKLVLAAESGTLWFAQVPAADKQEVQTPGRFLLNEFPQQ